MKIDTTTQKIIEDFIYSYPLPNAWLNLFDDEMSVYFRRGTHKWHSYTFDTLDIANWSVNEDADTRKLMVALLDFVEPQFNVFFENVFDISVLNLLEERSYDRNDIDDVPQCMWFADPGFEWRRHLLNPTSNSRLEKAYKDAMKVI